MSTVLLYGAHPAPKPFNKLIYLANKISQFSVLIKQLCDRSLKEVIVIVYSLKVIVKL